MFTFNRAIVIGKAEKHLTGSMNKHLPTAVRTLKPDLTAVVDGVRDGPGREPERGGWD